MKPQCKIGCRSLSVKNTSTSFHPPRVVYALSIFRICVVPSMLCSKQVNTAVAARVVDRSRAIESCQESKSLEDTIMTSKLSHQDGTNLLIIIIQMWGFSSIPPFPSFLERLPYASRFGCSRQKVTAEPDMWVSLCIVRKKSCPCPPVLSQSCRSNRIHERSLLKAKTEMNNAEESENTWVVKAEPMFLFPPSDARLRPLRRRSKTRHPSTPFDSVAGSADEMRNQVSSKRGAKMNA